MASRATTLDPKVADPRVPGTSELGSSAQPVAVENASESDIAALAYQLWQARGCPLGSPEEDWLEAERHLKRQ